MANFNFNRVFLGGRLVNTPELKVTPDGVFVTSFRIAVNRSGKNGGADFINCAAFREKAELITKYFSEGSAIFIIGELQTRSWKGTDGKNRYATDILVSEIKFVESKAESVRGNFVAPSEVTPSKAALDEFEQISGDEELPF